MTLALRSIFFLVAVSLAVGAIVLASRGPSPSTQVAASPAVDGVAERSILSDAPGVAAVTQRTAVSEPDIDAPTAPSDEVDRARIERMELLTGTITAEEYGPGFDDALRSIASEFAVKNIASNVEERASDYCGFRSLRDLNSALQGDGRVPASLLSELERLNASAVAVAAQVQDYVLASFELGIGLEAWERDQPHDSESWALANLDTQNEGLLHMSISTNVGARRFVLHFDSYDHPSLEGELQRLNLQKQAFWDAVRAH